MESGIPSWLDDSFLQCVLQSVEKTDNDVKIARFQCQPALPPGSNYFSYIYRLTVDYETDTESKSISLIAKVPLKPGIMDDFIKEIRGYEKEITTYQDILPKMYALHTSRLTPRSFTCSLDSSLVLEDLSSSGYIMRNRIEQLDLPHCCLVLKNLAKFHALSVAASHKYPDITDSLGPHFLLNDRIAIPEKQRSEQNTFQKFMKAAASIIETLSECEQYAEMIRSKLDFCWNKIVKLKNSSEGINVLCHNDPWTANFMFKYNSSDDVIDVKFVDFQLSSFGPFPLDVLSFFVICANEDVRENHREEIFEVYRYTFNNMLNELNCKEKLSKKEFDKNIRDHASYAVHAMTTVLPLVMADPDVPVVELTPADKNTPDDSPQWQRFQSKYYKALLPKLLRQVESLGAFL